MTWMYIDALDRNPEAVKLAYTTDSIWRNRDQFIKGRDEIVAFLSKKWEKENGYRLRKELFAFTDNKARPPRLSPKLTPILATSSNCPRLNLTYVLTLICFSR